MPSEPCQTFPQLIREVCSRHAERTFLPRADSHGGVSTTYADLDRESKRVGAGLLAIGLERGDRVGLVSENRREWVLTDLGCARTGIIDVPRGTDTAIAELEFILDHAGARMVFAENAATAREILARKDKLTGIETVCQLHGDEIPDGVMGLDELMAKGDQLLAEDPERFEQAEQAVQPDDVLTIVYTSGTTANPKGVMLTHNNLTSNIRNVANTLQFNDRDVFLSVLPAWHVYERILDYVAFASGASLVFTDRRRMKEDMGKIRPTAFAGVPRIWEMIYDGIVNHCRKQKGFKRTLLLSALETSSQVGAGKAGLMGRLLHGLYSKTILPKFLGATGGRLRIPVSGGGSLPHHVDAALLGMGLPILNGYGLTETSPVAAVRTPAANVVGTIGYPIPETEIEVRTEDQRPVPAGEVGVVWIRGPQVMKGYYRNSEQTERVLVDGWFNSGDLGRIDTRGMVRITGRAKDTIVLAGGENIEPEYLETQLKTSPFIEQAVVFGQDQKQLCALIIPSLDCLEEEIPRSEWAEQGQRITSERVEKFYRGLLEELLSRDRGFRPVERIHQFRLITELMTTENGLLTQTLKVKRHVVREHHAELLSEMLG